MQMQGQLGQLLNGAVHLKKQMMKEERPIYQALPNFLQNGLMYAIETKPIRDLPLAQKRAEFSTYKKQGNFCFSTENYSNAKVYYEKALTIYRFVENKQPGWREKGIFDKDLVYHEDRSKQAIEDMVPVYLNIAQCLIKLKDLKQAKAACDQAIRLAPNTEKAYYLKAKAVLTQVSKQYEDYDQAIQYLQKALQINKVPEIQNLLAETKRQKQTQYNKQKQAFKFIMANSKTNQVEQEKKQQKENEEQKKDYKGYKRPDPLIRVVGDADMKQRQQVQQKIALSLEAIAQMPNPMLRLKEDFILTKGGKIHAKLIIQGYKEAADQLKDLLVGANKTISLLHSKKWREAFQMQVADIMKTHEEILDRFLRWVAEHPTHLTKKYPRILDQRREKLKTLLSQNKTRQQQAMQESGERVPIKLKSLLFSTMAVLCLVFYYFYFRDQEASEL